MQNPHNDLKLPLFTYQTYPINILEDLRLVYGHIQLHQKKHS